MTAAAVEIIPARMSFDEIARRNAVSVARYEAMRDHEQELRLRRMEGPWSASDPGFVTALQGGAGNLTRLVMDWVASNMSPDDEVRGSIRRQRARARELSRSNSYVASYLNLLASNVIGPVGFTHKATVRNNDGQLATRINGLIEDAWAEWCEAASLDGQWSLTDLSQQSLRGTGTDGESFTRIWRGADHPHGIALEPMDPDVVDDGANAPGTAGDPEIRMGVRVDGYGRRTGFVTMPYPPYGTATEGPRVIIPGEDVIHMFRPRRVNQTRGVTWLGPAMIALKMLDGYEEAELIAARISSAKMGFFEAKTDEPPEAFNPEGAATRRPLAMEANPGTAEALPVGWTFKEWSPDHPSTAFPAFVKNVLRKVATALGVSYNALASDLEGVNYSSMRSGLLVERDTWRVLQAWWASRFLKRVYREWLKMAILTKRLSFDQRDPALFASCTFTPRGFPWIDPLKEVQAAQISVDSGFDSRTRIIADRGESFEEIVDELKAEEDYAIAAKVDIHRTSTAATSSNDPAANDGSGDNAPPSNPKTNGHVPREAVARAMRRGGRNGG